MKPCGQWRVSYVGDAHRAADGSEHGYIPQASFQNRKPKLGRFGAIGVEAAETQSRFVAVGRAGPFARGVPRERRVPEDGDARRDGKEPFESRGCFSIFVASKGGARRLVDLLGCT